MHTRTAEQKNVNKGNNSTRHTASNVAVPRLKSLSADVSLPAGRMGTTVVVTTSPSSSSSSSSSLSLLELTLDVIITAATSVAFFFFGRFFRCFFPPRSSCDDAPKKKDSILARFVFSSHQRCLSPLASLHNSTPHDIAEITREVTVTVTVNN